MLTYSFANLYTPHRKVRLGSELRRLFFCNCLDFVILQMFLYLLRGTDFSRMAMALFFLAVNVTVGQSVKKGDVLLVIEAMKMANDIVSEVDGTVQKVAVTVGQNVGLGDLLVDMVADFVAAEAPGLAPKPAPAAPAPVAAPAPKPAAGNNAVVAPLPGTVTKVLVKEGQQVGPNDTICLLEAMKMENTISAGTAGTVKKILVKEGVQVQQGEALVELA